eukprot:10273595-Heterocapsa_arctica.AAC.1
MEIAKREIISCSLSMAVTQHGESCEPWLRSLVPGADLAGEGAVARCSGGGPARSPDCAWSAGAGVFLGLPVGPGDSASADLVA